MRNRLLSAAGTVGGARRRDRLGFEPGARGREDDDSGGLRNPSDRQNMPALHTGGEARPKRQRRRPKAPAVGDVSW